MGGGRAALTPRGLKHVDRRGSRIAGIALVALGVAIGWFLIAELTWVDHRPVCSGLAMLLRPDIAGECFTGPRPLVVDAAVVPFLVALGSLLVLVVGASRLRPKGPSPQVRRRAAVAVGIVVVATAAAIATWLVASLTAPDLRPGCSGQLPPLPPLGPNCWNGPRDLLSATGIGPATTAFVTVLAVLSIGSWISSVGRRPRG